MIIVGIVEQQGPVPGATFLRTVKYVFKDVQGRVLLEEGRTENATYTNWTASAGGRTINDWWQAGLKSGATTLSWLGGEDGKQKLQTIYSNYDTGWNAPNSSSYGMVAFSHTTTTSPLTGRSGSLTFETTTVNIISAKDTTLGTSTDTYTSLTTIYSSTTSSVTKVPYISPVATYSSRTDVVQVYTELVQYWTQQLCYSTRYEVFDNSDGVTLAIATAGNGGLVSYRTLSPGEVVGEESYKFVTYDSQIFTVGTENFIESDYLPPPQTSNFSTTYAAVTETEISVAYEISATANRGYIGTYDTGISSASAESIWEKIGTYTITDNRSVGDTTVFTYKVTIPSTTKLTTTKHAANGAFVADGGAILFLKTATTNVVCAESTISSVTAVKYKPYAVVQVVDGYSEGAQGNVIQSEIVTKDSFPWRNEPVYKIAERPGFIMEPVGPPCIGGYNATGPQGLGFDDNCPFSFPAYLLWEAANDSRYAAVSASSFYIGGIPLISHEKQWEWQGRTYAWLSLNANGGALRVDSGGTATPSSSFTIKVTGNCTYTGGLSEMHAGGRYYSSNSQAQATLVANSPLIVSVENTTSSFAAGTYEITQPMKILPDQYGSVVLAGFVKIYPPNLKNNANAE